MGLEDRSQTRTIDNVEYKTHPVTFGVGRSILLKVARAAAPALKVMMAEGTAEEKMAGTLAALTGTLVDADIAEMAKAFGDASYYNDGRNMVPLTSMIQELHFAGRYDAFLQWLIFCMEVNGFGRFFTTMVNGGGAA